MIPTYTIGECIGNIWKKSDYIEKFAVSINGQDAKGGLARPDPQDNQPMTRVSSDDKSLIR